MAQSTLDRKTRFRMALALDKKTQYAWAEEQGVKGGHVSQVLSETRESKRLTDAIDTYIAQTFKAHKVKAA